MKAQSATMFYSSDRTQGRPAEKINQIASAIRALKRAQDFPPEQKSRFWDYFGDICRTPCSKLRFPKQNYFAPRSGQLATSGLI